MRPPRRLMVACALVVLAAASCDAGLLGRAPAGQAGRERAVGAHVTGSAERAPLRPPGRGGTVVVRSTGWRLPAFDEPDSEAHRTHRLWANNPWGQRIAYEVLEIVRGPDGEGWYRILIPFRPNGSTGWVRARDVRAARVHERIVVDLSAHVLLHYRRGALLASLDVAVGATGTPTPPGSYFVWAKVSYESPGGAYGTYALGLSGFSRVLTDWPGGGRLAIHGTADPTDIGRDVSHGCVRVHNPDLLRELRGVPLGTPVLIRP